jgi:drug/metabolite transporter (DMT)-like permease
MRDRQAAWAALLLSVAVLCWAGNFVIGRAVYADIPPVSLAFWRWGVAVLVLLPMAGPVAWRHRRVIWREWRLLGMLAVLGAVLFHICVYSGLRTTTATNGAILQAVVPVVMPLFSWLVLRAPLFRLQAAGILVSFVGVAAIVLRGAPAAITEIAFTPGDLWLLAAVPIWALYSVLLRRLPTDLPGLAMLMAIAAIGLVMLAPLYLVEVAHVGGFAVTVDSVLAVLYVGVFASVVAYVCWNRGVHVIGPNSAGLFLHLMPVFTTILAVMLLGERLYAYHAAGIALVAAGIVLSTSGGRRAVSRG